MLLRTCVSARSLRQLYTRSFSSTRIAHQRQRNVDDDCLPSKPTWSIYSLLESGDRPSITDEQFNRLFELAQLQSPSSNQEKEALKKDLDQISHFLEQIQRLDLENVEPLIQLWNQDTGLRLRDDVPEEEFDGRSLLKHAKKTVDGYYAVEGKVASTE